MSVFLIVGDELENLKYPSDTSLFFAQALLEQGYVVHWVTKKDIYLNGNNICAQKIREIFTFNDFVPEFKNHPQIQSLQDYQKVFIRCNPPFDGEYRDLCWLLSLHVPHICLNDPKLLLTYHEKTMHLIGAAEGFFPHDNTIPTWVGKPDHDRENFLNSLSTPLGEHGFILKPWLGFGGGGIVWVQNREQLQTQITNYGHDYVVLQPFLPQITTHGDRRVFIVNGHMVGHFVRFPAQGNYVSNLAQRGIAKNVPLNKKQEEIILKIIHFLNVKNIAIAGIDLIDDRIGEINITSPTGLRTLEQLNKRSFSKDFIEAF